MRLLFVFRWCWRSGLMGNTNWSYGRRSQILRDINCTSMRDASGCRRYLGDRRGLLLQQVM